MNKMIKKYDLFERYLTGMLGFTPNEYQLEELKEIARQQECYESNKGYKVERIERNPKERAFYEQWMEENIPMPGVNFGQGVLQDLFIEPDGLFKRKWITEITSRDRMIAATVIQWLGTNCGTGFLDSALSKFGAKIIYNK